MSGGKKVPTRGYQIKIYSPTIPFKEFKKYFNIVFNGPVDQNYLNKLTDILLPCCYITIYNARVTNQSLFHKYINDIYYIYWTLDQNKFHN